MSIEKLRIQKYALKEIEKNYHKKMTSVYLDNHQSKKFAKTEIKNINEMIERLEDRPALKERWISMHNMTFRGLKEGEVNIFGVVDSSIEEHLENIVYFKNRQYGWQLAESFELFKSVIQELYGFAGYVDKGFWRLKEFGSISLNELNYEELEFFKKKACDVRLDDILKRFSDNFRRIKSIENQGCGLNIRFVIKLVEQFRHAIVHERGVFRDADKLRKDLMKAVSNEASEVKSSCSQYLEEFLVTSGGSVQVALIEKEIKKGGVLEINRFNTLTDILMAYTNEVVEALDKWLDSKS